MCIRDSLTIYADYDKRLGAYKIHHVLQRDCGVRISVGRVYRLMRSMHLPKTSTAHPRHYFCRSDDSLCPTVSGKALLKMPLILFG